MSNIATCLRHSAGLAPASLAVYIGVSHLWAHKEQSLKKLVLVMCVSLLVGCSSFTHKSEKAVNYTYGYVGASDCEKQNNADAYPIKRQECSVIGVIIKSQDIQMFPGVAFGVQYEISNLTERDCYTVTHKLTHPEMQTPGGKRSEYFRNLKVGNCNLDTGNYNGVFSWLVEAEWEAVKGIWEFEILLDGDILVSQKLNAI